MTKLNENAYEYKGSPTQKGTWMQEITETKKNCATKKIFLHRDCLTCPVMSSFGVLKTKQTRHEWYLAILPSFGKNLFYKKMKNAN
jgi:hypothetical protein